MLNELFVELSSMPDFDEDSLIKAKEVFNEYQKKGTLINCEFDDDKWTITDEYSIMSLNFTIDEFLYRRFYEEIFELSKEDFVNNIKIFVANILGRYVANTIHDFLNDVRRIIKTNPQNLIDGKDTITLFSATMCLDFLYMMPSERNFEIIEAIEGNIENEKSGQRTLAEFDTYFLFSDILDDFWKSEMDDKTRLFFFPVYLWWHITAVIPLRPREFLLTGRDCLKEKDGKYYLTVRRNELKGRRKRGVKYKIAEDYSTQRLRITPELANEIQKYIDLTADYKATDIDTLFITDPHYRKWERSKSNKNRFYTMSNLYTCLKYFYQEVIADMYHLKIVNKTDHINDGEIGRINLGDTRHLSLINLMAEGGTPTLAMKMAGHTNIEMASHYYSNITNLIECRTYRKYRQVMGGKIDYQIVPMAFFPIREDGLKLSDGNLCFSEEMKNRSVKHCLESVGPNGEIGYCPTCTYYRRDGSDFFQSDDIYKKQIEDDCKLLADVIARERKYQGCKEDITEALLKLKASSLSYSQYLMEKGNKNA